MTTVIDIATPIVDERGERLGVLLFTLDWSQTAASLPHARQDRRGDALLVDAWSPDQLGGTGHRLPLEWLSEARLPIPWWLAGGISSEWIPELLSQVSPDGLDASSRLEVRPGWKDLNKVASLLKAVSPD